MYYIKQTKEIDMYQGKQRGVEIHENGRLVAVGGMKDFIIDNNLEETDQARAILSLQQGDSTNVSTNQGQLIIRRNDNV
jgi:hypothetical protein|tara:strand:+ start:510 stop:746 length:237 start_codon:yes stop_codon:yes gene_type:complete